MSMPDDSPHFDRIGYLLAHRGSVQRIEALRVEAAIHAEAPAYPGVLVLPDELGARRFVVRGMIAEEKTIRTDALQEPGWKEELTSLRGWLVDDARTDAHALPAMTQDQRDRLSWLEGVESRISQIEAHAAALDRTARDASPDTLAAMAADISQGWPA